MDRLVHAINGLLLQIEACNTRIEYLEFQTKVLMRRGIADVTRDDVDTLQRLTQQIVDVTNKVSEHTKGGDLSNA